jgi:alkylmercury lyase
MAGATAQILHESDAALIQWLLKLLRPLLDGAPVSAARFAASAGMSDEEADAVFARRRAWGAEFAADGAFMGGGLTLVPTPHRYEVQSVKGHRFFTWCAGDAIIFPLPFGHTAEINSPDPVSGDRVQFTVSPASIETFTPATAVLSGRCGAEAANVRGSICAYGHFFASRETAASYIALHDGLALAVLTPEEEFRCAQFLVRPGAAAERQGSDMSSRDARHGARPTSGRSGAETRWMGRRVCV